MDGFPRASVLLAMSWFALVPASSSFAAAPALNKDQYHGFAMSHAGDAERGKALFSDAQRLACARCHATGGKTTSVGPDLATIGDKFGRSELADAVLSPSAQIAIGYSTTIITTRDGDVIDGIIKDAGDDQITLVGVDAQPKQVKAADIADRRVSAVSMMPEGLQNRLTR